MSCSSYADAVKHEFFGIRGTESSVEGVGKPEGRDRIRGICRGEEMVAEFIATDDPRWADVLIRLEHDVYDLPRYIEMCSEYEHAKPAAFYSCEGDCYCLIPLLLRRLPCHLGAPSEWCDASSPYGYSSALFCGDALWYGKAMEAFTKTCRANNIISVFIRLNPLIDFPADETAVPGERTLHGRTVGVDLTLSEEEIRKQARQNHRVNISRLRREKFTTTVDDWSRYSQFIKVYDETMDRLNADSYYRFGVRYFERLKEALNEKLHLLSVISPDGQMAAGKLLTEVNGIVQYHLGGTATQYRGLAPAKLAVDAAIWWAKERGNRILHLGGGVGGREDELFRFKQGFSERTFQFETWRIVTDSVKYAQVARAGAWATSDSPSFFPSYRAGNLNGVL